MFTSLLLVWIKIILVDAKPKEFKKEHHTQSRPVRIANIIQWIEDWLSDTMWEQLTEPLLVWAQSPISEIAVFVCRSISLGAN